MTRRRYGRWIAVGAAALVAIGALALVGVRLWVGSARGRSTVEHQVDDAVARRFGGHAHIGKISGSLVGGVTLDDVVWRDDAGRVGLRARRVVARWSAARTLARRPAIELRVEGADVDVERVLGGADLDEAARAVAEKRDAVDAVTVTRLEVVDATVRVRGEAVHVARLVGAARLDKGDGRRDGEGDGRRGGEGHLGDRGELSLDRLQARAEAGGVPWNVSGGGTLRWDRAAGTVDAERLRLRAGDSSVVVANGHVGDGAVDLRLTALRIGPDDLRRLSPRAEAPRTALRGDGRARGRFDDVRIDGELRPDAGAMRVAGTLDLLHRRARAHVTLDDVETDYTPAVLAGTVDVRGAAGDGALTVDWTADGRYFRREVDPNLQAAALSVSRRRAFAAVRPGGRFSGSGRLAAHLASKPSNSSSPSRSPSPSVEMRFRLRVVDPGQAARLVAGPDLRATTRPLVLDGVWTLPPHAPASLTMHRR